MFIILLIVIRKNCKTNCCKLYEKRLAGDKSERSHWIKHEIDKVFLYHDKASSHASNVTTSYLDKIKEEFGVSYISKEDINFIVTCSSCWDLEAYSRGVVKDRSRFNQKRIQQLEKALTVDISKGRRTKRANKRDLSKTFTSIKIN